MSTHRVPEGAGTSPADCCVVHFVPLKKSMMPTRAPAPVMPAPCHAKACMIETASLVTAAIGRPALDGCTLRSSGSRT